MQISVRRGDFSVKESRGQLKKSNYKSQFFDNNLHFMSKYPVSRDKIFLLRGMMFRVFLMKIKENEGEDYEKVSKM